MAETWRWRDALAAAERLRTNANDREVLLLALRLPFLDASLAARLVGRPGSTAIYRSLASLRSAELLGSVRPPLRSGHSPSLFYATDLGLAALALDRGCEPASLAASYGVRRADLRRLLLGLPYLQATYAMLGALVGSEQNEVELLGWERPWRRRFWRPTAKAPVTLVLPAGATLRHGRGHATILLCPDPGAVPLRAYREMVQRLFAYRRSQDRLPPLLIATSDDQRAGAWARLLCEVQRRESEAPLDLKVTTWCELAASPPALGGGPRVACPPSAERAIALRALLRPPRPTRTLPRVIGDPPGIGAADPTVRAASELTPAEREMLALIGEHPFLSPRQLAALVGTSSAVVLRRRNQLITRCLVRIVESREVNAETTDAKLVELTVPGLTVVAAQLGLSLAAAVRWCGLAGGGPGTPIGARRDLAAHLAHTRGADALFVNLVATARRRAERGGDDRLLVWRNAASCSRRHLRPDGYGIYRHAGHLYGFFLEYDRGTMRARDYRQKLGAYYDYWISGTYELDYDGFPTILLVATDNAAEERLAQYVRAAGLGRGVLLPALLTCEWRIFRDPNNPDGLLGPIWRTPGADFTTRRFWPLAETASPTHRDDLRTGRSVTVQPTAEATTSETHRPAIARQSQPCLERRRMV